MNSLYVVGNFLSSKHKYFPTNKPEHFWLKLEKPLLLTGGSWKVCLCEIQFQNVLVEAGQSVPTHYQIELATCEGLYIDGSATNALRVIPYRPTSHQIFTKPFYMSLQSAYVDICEIEIKLVDATHTIIRPLTGAVITCTLHFKR